MISFWCHGSSIVHTKVIEARKRVPNENCHQDVIKRKIKPKVPQQIPSKTIFMKMTKKFEFWRVFA